MTTPAPSAATEPSFPPLDRLLTVISDRTRWRILDEILKGEPLPVYELARRLGVPPANISKHVAVLARAGVVVAGFGRCYRIPSAYLVPGQRALDLGAVVLRLDHLDHTR